MIDLAPEELTMNTYAGHGLRETLFYGLFVNRKIHFRITIREDDEEKLKKLEAASKRWSKNGGKEVSGGEVFVAKVLREKTEQE
ncbi:unnamed protein product [Cochlearia groenlandica]